MDAADYARVDATFNEESTQGDISGWLNGDFDYNDQVDGADYALIDGSFNAQSNTLSQLGTYMSSGNWDAGWDELQSLLNVQEHRSQFGHAYDDMMLGILGL